MSFAAIESGAGASAACSAAGWVAAGGGASGESDFLHTGTVSLASSTGGTFARIATAVAEPGSFLLLAAGLVTFLYARSREPDGVRRRGDRRSA